MSSIVIDVREPGEYKESHVVGAINIPPADLLTLTNEKLGNLPKDTTIIVYCRTGSRSRVAKDILEQFGYKNIINGVNKEQVESRYL